eukprot:9479428-Pyramimonas_sp.AAC.1
MCIRDRPSTTFRGPIWAPPKVTVAQSACVSLTQYSASWPHWSPTEGPRVAVRMRLPHPVQRFVAP